MAADRLASAFWTGLALLALDLTPAEVAATGGTCTGGANAGGACVTSADCDSLCIGGSGAAGCAVDGDCGPACASGPDQGEACTSDTDCLDTCIGGFAEGGPCLSDLHCLGLCGGSSWGCTAEFGCESLGVCVGGPSDGGPCMVFGGTTYDCDGGVCDLDVAVCEGTGTCGNAGLCQTGTCETAVCAPNGSNVCFLDALGEYRDILIVLGGFSDTVVTPGDPIALGSTQATLTVPEDLILEAYRSFAIGTGVSIVAASFDVEILAQNSVEGSQVRLGSDSGSTTVTDPDTNRNNGNESATPVVLTAALSSTSWTASPVALDVVFTQGAVVATVGVGPYLDASFDCQPGIADVPPTSFSPVPPTPFWITEVYAPPTAPSAIGDSATVPALGTVDIDVLANDFDVNGDIDPATIEITFGPSQGSVLIDPSTGVVRYFSTNPTPGTDQFLYRVSDETGLTSGVASAGVDIASPIPGVPGVALPVLALGLGVAGVAVLVRRKETSRRRD